MWIRDSSNPCVRVKPPKQLRDTSDIQYFTEEETAAFLQFLSDGTEAGEIKLQYNIFYQIAIFCGLRRGESIAMLWSCLLYTAPRCLSVCPLLRCFVNDP